MGRFLFFKRIVWLQNQPVGIAQKISGSAAESSFSKQNFIFFRIFSLIFLHVSIVIIQSNSVKKWV